MQSQTLATLTDGLRSVWQYLWQPIAEAAWSDWPGFWLRHVLDDRFLVCFFLPLLPILLLLPRRHLRIGIVLTGLVFLACIFGVLFAAGWLALCAGFYLVAERFAVHVKRRGGNTWRSALAAVALVSGGFVLSLALQRVALPPQVNQWLFHNAPWLFPLGVRQLPWEGYANSYTLLLEPGVKAQPPQLFHIAFVFALTNGLVILTVRMMHYYSELRRDSIPREQRTFLRFLAYLCYAPALMQGPIERFSEFQQEIDTCHTRRSWRNRVRGLARMALGLSKSLFCTLYIFPLVWEWICLGRYYSHPEQIENYAVLALGVHLQALWLYVGFSGYCDVSAGMAHLLGYRQIENFDRPWLATSLRDFWRRWNISFSLILRDYVYIPLGGSRRAHTRNLFVTFLVCGLLHALLPNFILWGLLMALMVAVNHAWSQWMKRLDRQPGSRCAAVRRAWLKLQPLPRLCAWFLTMNAFVGSGLVMVAGTGGLRVAWEFVRRPLTWLAQACGWDLP